MVGTDSDHRRDEGGGGGGGGGGGTRALLIRKVRRTSKTCQSVSHVNITQIFLIGFISQR